MKERRAGQPFLDLLLDVSSTRQCTGDLGKEKSKKAKETTTLGEVFPFWRQNRRDSRENNSLCSLFFKLSNLLQNFLYRLLLQSTRQGTPLSKHLFISIHLPLASLQVFGSFADSWHHLPHHHLRVIEAPEVSGHWNIPASFL